jgi:hypothetical protein
MFTEHMLMQLREMMEYQQNRDQYDGLEDAANSSSGGERRATYRPDAHSSEVSLDHDDSDDDEEAAMTPRGIYVQRCLCDTAVLSMLSLWGRGPRILCLLP